MLRYLNCFLKQAQLGGLSDQGTIFCLDFGYANLVIMARKSLENMTKKPLSGEFLTTKTRSPIAKLPICDVVAALGCTVASTFSKSSQLEIEFVSIASFSRGLHSQTTQVVDQGFSAEARNDSV